MIKIVLLDSNSLINRAFYAIPTMTTRDGVFTNAVYGYLSMLARLISEHKPTHICAVFDLKGPTFRNTMYDGYKATRKPMPEELASQLSILRQLLDEMGVTIMQKEGYEADDIIGTLGKRFDYDTIIVSGDRDVLQLVDYNTVVFNTKRGVTDIKVYDLEALAEEDFTPEKVIEYKALAGDSSDNIPGCPGVGQKTALSLLKDYRDIDGVYANIGEIKGKLQDRLIENKELVYLSKKLATIDTAVPIECTLDDLAFAGIKDEEFFAHLQRLECRSLIERFKKATQDPSDKPLAAEPLVVAEPIVTKDAITTYTEPIVFDTGSSLPQTDSEDFAPVRTKISGIEKLCAVLAEPHQSIAFDFGADIVFAFDDTKEYYIEPAVSLLDDGIDYAAAAACFQGVLAGDTKKIAFDIKGHMSRLSAYGLEILPPYEDILLKTYLIDVNRTPRDLKELADSRGMGGALAQSIYRLDRAADNRLSELGLISLYCDIELPLIKVLYDMETAGFSIDKSVLNELSEKYTEEIADLQKRIYAIAGETFNINSPSQLAGILFDKLGLKPTRKTKGKTAYSVAAEVLEELEHPIIEAILRYRMLSKLQSTYINGMRSVIDHASGKVHTVFRQCLTTTGRLSSNEPNLQNIPIRTEEGRNIRRMFVPSKGNVLVSADYSQIELRLLAHFSAAPDLMRAYKQNIDIHTLTASKIFDTPLDEVTKDMRRDAKAVNFGIIYGISAFGLARNTGITNGQARDFIAKYFLTYPGVVEYMESNVNFAKEHGYVTTLSGRIRFFPELRSPNRNVRSFGERAALNMPLQGSAADIMKIAMLKVHRALKDGGYKAKLILQVHDELVIDTPAEEEESVKKLLVANMESAATLNVPLIAEAKSGKNWFE